MVQLRTWVWFKLYGKVRPLCAVGKEQEEMEHVLVAKASMEETLKKEVELAAKLEKEAKVMQEEHAQMVRSFVFWIELRG